MSARLLALALALLSVACDKKKEAPSAPSVSVAPSSSASPASTDGHAIAVASCMSCHSEEMLAQQRLPKEKWAAEVKKMAGWGANLDPIETDALVTWLADKYGTDAGAFKPQTIDPLVAALEIAPAEDGPFANGDAARGKPLYVDRCSGCHGPDALGAPGALGVVLADRPMLYQAKELAEIVRRGRGKMAPIKATDSEIADILAHLRAKK